jgi:hypothetical protein
MAVLRWVELNPVPCAKADTVLRVRMAAITRSDGSREWTLVAIVFVSFIAFMIFVFFPSAAFPPNTRSQSHKRGERRCM